MRTQILPIVYASAKYCPFSMRTRYIASLPATGGNFYEIVAGPSNQNVVIVSCNAFQH